MLVCYMNKIILYIIYLFAIFTLSYSKEPTLAILRSVYTNEFQRFSIGMHEFTCRPYGVVTLEELYHMEKIDATCKKSIVEYYIENPMDKYFSENLLKNRQVYHIEPISKRCVLYANGRATLSELLVKKGLAVVKPKLKDEEFLQLLTQTQNYAKDKEIGLFKDKALKRCIVGLYEEEEEK